MSQNESTPFLLTDAKNLTLIDATRENSPGWSKRFLKSKEKTAYRMRKTIFKIEYPDQPGFRCPKNDTLH